MSPAGNPEECLNATRIGTSAASSASGRIGREPHVGDMLAHYRLVERLGAGRMGIVFKAHEESLKRHVAIKVLSPDLAVDGEFAERFLHEAQAIAALSHPNLVHVYYTGRQENWFFFAMELVEGKALDELLEEKNQLTEVDALSYIRQAALGLQHAHEHGIINRDVKPANLMLTPNGLVKLADFGLAKVISDIGATTTTNMHSVIGTPLYMSPEQAEGSRVDHRSDIYSLGASLYHLIAGRPPFIGDTHIIILKQQLQNRFPPLRRFAPALSVATEQIVARTLAKNPEDRYQSYSDLIHDLDSVLDPRHSQNGGESTSSIRSRMWTLTMILVIVGFVWLFLDKVQREDQPPLRPRSSNKPMPVTTAPLVAKPVILESQPEPSVTDLARWQKAINLLPLIDPNQDTVAGAWRLENGELICEKAWGARVMIPFSPPEAYDFRIVFTRPTENRDVVQILSYKTRSFTWHMGAHDNRVFTFGMTADTRIERDPAAKRVESCLENGRQYSSVVQVRRDGVRAYLDGLLLIERKTDFKEVMANENWALPDSTLIGVGSWDQSTIFHRIEVLELSGKGQFIRPDDPAAKEAENKRSGTTRPRQ